MEVWIKQEHEYKSNFRLWSIRTSSIKTNVTYFNARIPNMGAFSGYLYVNESFKMFVGAYNHPHIFKHSLFK